MLRILHTLAFLALVSGSALAQPWVPTALRIQSDTTSLAHVAEAFRVGDVDLLLGESAGRIEVVVFGRGAAYSRGQAAAVLLDFFRRYPPARVAFEEEVVGKDRRSVIGRYWADTSAAPMAVTVRLRARGADWRLQGVRVDRAPH